jgi:hypothetical protein
MKNSITENELQNIINSHYDEQTKKRFTISESNDSQNEEENLNETFLFYDNQLAFVIADNRLTIYPNFNVQLDITANIEFIDSLYKSITLSYNSESWLTELTNDVSTLIKAISLAL